MKKTQTRGSDKEKLWERIESIKNSRKQKSSWKKADLIGAQGEKLIQATLNVGTRRIEQQRGCQVAVRRAIFIVIWGLSVELNQKGPCVPLRDWSEDVWGALVAWGQIMTY